MPGCLVCNSAGSGRGDCLIFGAEKWSAIARMVGHSVLKGVERQSRSLYDELSAGRVTRESRARLPGPGAPNET